MNRWPIVIDLYKHEFATYIIGESENGDLVNLGLLRDQKREIKIGNPAPFLDAVEKVDQEFSDTLEKILYFKKNN